MPIIEPSPYTQALADARSPDANRRAEALTILGKMATFYAFRGEDKFLATHHLDHISRHIHRGLIDKTPMVWRSAANAIFAIHNTGLLPENDTQLREEINAFALNNALPLFSYLKLKRKPAAPKTGNGAVVPMVEIEGQWWLTNAFPFTLDGEAPRVPIPKELLLGRPYDFEITALLQPFPEHVVNLETPFGTKSVVEPMDDDQAYLAAAKIRFLAPDVQGLWINVDITSNNVGLLNKAICVRDIIEVTPERPTPVAPFGSGATTAQP
jgi:hypothetical protein